MIKRLFFRLRLMLLATISLPGGWYYRLVKARFPTHGYWLRSAVPRLIGRLFLALYGIRLRVTGVKNLTPNHAGGAVVFANHLSRLDPYVLFALLPFPYKSFWSTKAHVTSESIGFARRFGEDFDLFFVHDKKNPRRTAKEFRHAIDYVREGNVLSLFPEGRFSNDGTPGDFGIACAKLAIKAKAPIIPVAISGTDAFFESRDAQRRGPVKVMVGAAISTADHSPGDARDLSQQLETVIQQMHATLTSASPNLKDSVTQAGNS